ncbi:exopolyphosphatase [Chloropicon primus]|uniref:Exopolyphosphatase n=1 Tax=Chloropicon primus TaxID=1764295 RepID=A0A5B8MHT6_9CHLO|nr:exopolyphosphatase [Chloropicon primus]UPQ98140.1 exopolyphosphatase [Chloropicon primus]|eukprot:QDZ18932.1 exopolyphosphatase [Chloropicon primus]
MAWRSMGASTKGRCPALWRRRRIVATPRGASSPGSGSGPRAVRDGEVYLPEVEEGVRKWSTDVSKSPYLKGLGGEDGAKDSLTLCAVDMGTNSFHMVIVKADPKGNVVVVEQMKEEVRILGGSGSFNVIMEETEAYAISVLHRMQNIASSKGCDQVRLVGTSAVREARNSNAFLRKVRNVTGLQVEVISGQEEARLVYLGAMQAVPIRDKDVLVVDIGGGSTEILYGKGGKPAFAISLQLGHLRLFEQCMGALDESGFIPGAKVDECRSKVQLVLNETGIKEELLELMMSKGSGGEAGMQVGGVSQAIDVAVGCSGTIERVEAMISAMKQAPPVGKALKKFSGKFALNDDSMAGSTGAGSKVLYTVHDNLEEGKFTKAGLKDLVAVLVSCKSRKERSNLPGMNIKRVDLIVSGALILEGIMDYLELDSMTVSPFALREGIIFDSLTKSIPGFKPTPCIRRDSLMQLARRFDTENRLRSAKHSAKLAKLLVESLRSGPRPPPALELLDDRFEFLLEAAILLHSVGIFVNHAKHHKHAYYIIKNSDILLGFTPTEVEILALLALYHRKKYPNPKKATISSLPKEIQDRIVLMTGIMRVCIALDRRNTASAVESIQVLHDEEGESCVLVAEPGVNSAGVVHDITFELWAVKQELDYFASTVGRAFTVVEGDRAEPDQEGSANPYISS